MNTQKNGFGNIQQKSAVKNAQKNTFVNVQECSWNVQKSAIVNI